MQHNIFVILFAFLLPFQLLAHNNNSSNSVKTKPYVVVVGPEQLNYVRVNIENYEPNNKDVKKFEINFGDGVKVSNSKDVIHKYLTNGTFTLVVKTWDNKNVVTTYTQALDINTSYQVSDISNSTVLGPIDVRDEKKYKFNLTSAQAQKLYKVTVTKNSQTHGLKGWVFGKRCKRDYNVEINGIDVFNEDEINCRTTKIEKFAWLNTSNIVRFEAEEPRWKSSFKFEIHAVEIIKNLDTQVPILAANVNSDTLTKNNKIHILVNDASATTTYVWNGQQQLIGTVTDKEFDLTLSEGLNNFVLQSVDASDNRSAFLYLSNITLDTVLPTISSSPASQYIYSHYPQSFTLNLTADEDLQSLTVNNQPALMSTPRSFSYVVQINEPQTAIFSVKAYDLAGNEKIQSYSVIFGLDNIAPVLSSNMSSDIYTNQSTFNVSVSDNAETTTKVYREGELVLTSQNKNFALSLGQGQNNFSISSVDQYGNQAVDLLIQNVVYDITVPSASSNLVQNYLFNSLPQSLSVQFAASEALSYAEVNGGQTQIFENNKINAVLNITNEGAQTVSLKIKDLAQNETNITFTFNVSIDNARPIVNISSLQTLTNSSEVTAHFTVVDASSTVMCNKKISHS